MKMSILHLLHVCLYFDSVGDQEHESVITATQEGRAFPAFLLVIAPGGAPTRKF